MSEPELNKDTHGNRGVEFILSGGKKKEQPKTFQIKFGNMLSFFKRDIVLHLNFYLDIRKNNSSE